MLLKAETKWKVITSGWLPLKVLFQDQISHGTNHNEQSCKRPWWALHCGAKPPFSHDCTLISHQATASYPSPLTTAWKIIYERSADKIAFFTFLVWPCFSLTLPISLLIATFPSVQCSLTTPLLDAWHFHSRSTCMTIWPGAGRLGLKTFSTQCVRAPTGCLNLMQGKEPHDTKKPNAQLYSVTSALCRVTHQVQTSRWHQKKSCVSV